MTVTLHEALKFVPSVVVAIIVAAPGDRAVTVPLASTDATLLLLDDHSTVLTVALSGRMVAMSVSFSPKLRERLDLLSDIDSARILVG